MSTPRISKYICTVQRSLAGLGLFTTSPIKKGDFIIEYHGKRLTPEKAYAKGGKYLFEINGSVVIDGSPRSNTARYINHSCRPNCYTNIVRGRVYIYAKRKISPGEELAYDYGKEYFEDLIKPHGCRCIKCSPKSVKKMASKNKIVHRKR